MTGFASFVSSLFLVGTSLCSAASPNPKRGLVFVESPDPTANSWNESSIFATVPQQTFEFVPMYWGAGDVNDTSFLANITGLVKDGLSVSHVLGFNQPDLSSSEGGSNLEPADAARLWINNFLPLQELGIKIGLPVVNAHRDPTNWTVPFVDNCTALIQKESGDKTKNCSFDFVPIHVFGNMSVFTTRIERFAEVFPDKPIWITEYADNDQDLATTQAFFNASIQYLDNSTLVERYSYFGSFRADVSNVGPNAAMLDPYNRLTDIGSWYLGGSATGNLPVYGSTGQSGGGAGNGGGSGSSSGGGSGGSSSCSAAHPCGQGNTAARGGRFEHSIVAQSFAPLGLLSLLVMW